MSELDYGAIESELSELQEAVAHFTKEQEQAAKLESYKDALSHFAVGVDTWPEDLVKRAGAGLEARGAITPGMVVGLRREMGRNGVESAHQMASFLEATAALLRRR